MLYPVIYAATALVLLGFCIWRRIFKSSGLIAAFFVYFAAVFVYGINGYAMLVGSFVLVNVLDFIFAANRKTMNADYIEGATQMTALDVLSRYGIAVAVALIGYITTDVNYEFVFFVCLAAAFTNDIVSKADTIYPMKAYNIYAKEKGVTAGTVGAFTAVGCMAAFVAAFLFGCSLVFLTKTLIRPIICVAVGLVACFADKTLALLIQEKFKCAECGIVTEKPTHCGTANAHESGIEGIDGNSVRFAVSFLFCAIAYILVKVISI